MLAKDGGRLVRNKLVLVLLLVTVCFLGIWYGSVVSSAGADSLEKEARFESIGTAMEVMAIVKSRSYFQPVDVFGLVRGYLQEGTINGMLSKTLSDPYTRYMDSHAYERMMTSTRGVFGGIGIVVGMQEERLTVISPIRGTPGERAGLRGGDKITRIDGKDTTYMTLDEAVSLMRGPEGEDVTLTITREDQVLEVYIVRAIINVESVSASEMVAEGVGYVEITNFSDRTYGELVDALASLDDEGMDALILDLRFNPGGTLGAALLVADLFISQGPLVHLEDQRGNRTPYLATNQGTRASLPMVVLINGGSASSSEIVAGALKDTGNAVLVGTKSFGKGLVQSVYPLRDGGALTVTEQAYLTSGGRNINKVGIEPDFVVELAEEEEEALYRGDASFVDPQLQTAIDLLLARTQIP